MTSERLSETSRFYFDLLNAVVQVTCVFYFAVTKLFSVVISPNS